MKTVTFAVMPTALLACGGAKDSSPTIEILIIRLISLLMWRYCAIGFPILSNSH
jgi:hypothetical protein